MKASSPSSMTMGGEETKDGTTTQKKNKTFESELEKLNAT